MEIHPTYRSFLLNTVAHSSVQLGEALLPRPPRRAHERRRAWRSLLWLAGWLVRYWTGGYRAPITPATLRPVLERERGACACDTIPCACRRSLRLPIGPTPRLYFCWGRTGRRQGCRFGHTPRTGIGRSWRTPCGMRDYNGSGQIMAVLGVALTRVRGARRSTLFYGRLWRIGILFTLRIGLRARDLAVDRLPEPAHDPPDI